MIPDFLLKLPLDLIKRAADSHGVEWQVLAAIVMVESGGNASATRYETGYRYLLSPATWANQQGITQMTETIHQKTSWGLCQIMGANLRDMGFAGPLPESMDPPLNLDYGARFLRKLSDRGYNEEQVISAYNQGSPRKRNGMYANQRYVDKVYHYIREVR